MSAKIKRDHLKCRNVKSLDNQLIYAVCEKQQFQLPKSINDKLNSSPKKSEKSKSLAKNEFQSDKDQRQDAEIISGDKLESMTVRSTQDNQGQVQSGTTNTIVTRLLSTRRMIQCNFCLETRYSMQYYSTSNRKIKSCLNCLDKFERWLIQGDDQGSTNENLDENRRHLHQQIELLTNEIAPPTSPEILSHSTSASRAHPCPKDDANQHMFHSHELRKFTKSCQQPEQVGASTKPMSMSPTESYQPRTTRVRPTSPAYDAKPHTFHGNEFPKATEFRAKINGPKPNDNKATIIELQKQISWDQRQRHTHQGQSRTINQVKPILSHKSWRIGKENVFKVHERRDFRKDMENQFNDTTSSSNKWEPENQKIQRSKYGSPVKSNTQCRSEHRIDNIWLENNQFKRQGAEEQVNRRATTASSQPTITSERTPCHLRDAKEHMINQNATLEILKPLESRSKFDYSIVNDYKPNGQELPIQSTWSQRQSLELDKIENRRSKFENSIFDKGCEIEKLAHEDDLKQDSSNSCQETKKCLLAFDIMRKSNDWREQEHQTLENCSTTLNTTINSNDLESDRPKVGNQRQGREFIKFEDQVPRYEVPVYTTYDQRMGFDIGKECIIEHQGFSGPYQPRQYKEISPDILKSTKYLDRLSPNVVNQQLTLENPISPCARWGSESENLEIRQEIDEMPENPYHREYSQLVSQRVGEDPGNFVVNEWHQSNDRHLQPLHAIRNSGIRRPRYISEWPQLIGKSVCSTSTCEYLNDLINLVRRSQSKIQEHVQEILKIIERISSRHKYKFNGTKVISVVKITLPSIVSPNRSPIWFRIVKALSYVTRYVSTLYAKGRKTVSPRIWQRLICIAKTSTDILDPPLKCTNEFEQISSTIEQLGHNCLANSLVDEELENRLLIQEKKDYVSNKLENSNLTLETIVLWYKFAQTKSINRMVRYNNSFASIAWFGRLVHVPHYEFVVYGIENRHNFEIHQEHHRIINQIHQRTEGYFSIKKCEVQSKHEIDAKKLYTPEWEIHRRVYQLPFGVIYCKKSKRFRIALTWLNLKYQRFNQFVAHRMDNILKGMDVDKVETEIFCSSSITSKVIVTILDYQESSLPASIGSGQSFKEHQWIVWLKDQTVLSWLVILEPKLVSAHKLAVLGVIKQDDGLAQGLDRETGGSVKITASNTDSKNQSARTCHKNKTTSQSAELKFEEMAESKQANGRNVIILAKFKKNSL